MNTNTNTKKVTCLTTWNGTDYYYAGKFVSGNESGYDVNEYELLDEAEAVIIARNEGFENFTIDSIELDLA